MSSTICHYPVKGGIDEKLSECSGGKYSPSQIALMRGLYDSRNGSPLVTPAEEAAVAGQGGIPTGHISEAAATGSWTDGAKQELDNLINQIENGTAAYKRFPQEASEGFRQGGRVHEAASVILRGSGGADSAKPLPVSERYERDKRQQPVQEKIIEDWARSEGVWFDNLNDAVRGKKQVSEGGEAKVFYNGDGTVTKLITTEYFITPQLALDRVTLHNTLFPEAPLTLRGFGRNGQGEFVFVVDQPFIVGTTPTMREIQDFMEKSGFKRMSDKGNTYTNGSVYLSDLHDENVIKTPQGNLVVIDVDARLNTPDLNKGGSFRTDDSVQPVAAAS